MIATLLLAAALVPAPGQIGKVIKTHQKKVISIPKDAFKPKVLPVKKKK